jgi:hypothetical protein
MKGSFLGWFVGLVVHVEDIFILPWLLWSAQCKIVFFLIVHYFTFCVSVDQQPGQAVVLGRRSLYLCVSGLYILQRLPTGYALCILILFDTTLHHLLGQVIDRVYTLRIPDLEHLI